MLTQPPVDLHPFRAVAIDLAVQHELIAADGRLAGDANDVGDVALDPRPEVEDPVGVGLHHELFELAPVDALLLGRELRLSRAQHEVGYGVDIEALAKLGAQPLRNNVPRLVERLEDGARAHHAVEDELLRPHEIGRGQRRRSSRQQPEQNERGDGGTDRRH